MTLVMRSITSDEDDYSAYVSLLQQLVPTQEPISYQSYHRLVDKHSECPQIYLCEEEGNVVGTIKILLEEKFYREKCVVAHIEDVIVDEDHRGNNVGKFLVNFAIDYAKNNLCYKLMLTCKDEYITFYQKCGFKVENNNMCLRCT